MPSYFRVLHNDHIGGLAVAKGRYRIVLLSVGPISCARASTLFARFLQDYDGVLPRPWLVDPGTGSFSRGHRNVGFRIEPWAGPVPSGSASGTHPSDGTRCPGTFRVLHRDSIGRLTLRAGPYIVTRLRGRSPVLRSGIAAARGLPPGLRGRPAEPMGARHPDGTFRRGPGGGGFRIKPARAR